MKALVPYLAAFRARFAMALQYRSAVVAGVVTQAWWAAINVTVYSALYTQGTFGQRPISLSGAIAYTWMQQGLLTVLPFSCDPEVANSIRSGTIVYDRIRPVDTYFWWFSRSLAKTVGRAVPRFALMFVFAAGILPMIGLGRWSLNLPSDVQTAFVFLLSVGMGLLVSAAIAVLMDTLATSMMSPAGVNAMAMPTVLFLSGSVVPLPLLPEFVQHLSLLQPFAALTDIPVRIYLGMMPLGAAPIGLATQLIWLVCLIAIGRYMQNATMARLEIQGG
ncbi:ABC transporter permease [Rhizobium ruizarguesonis]|uniref:ABC transporter permease n=1 Tax=Rhizobium ruizarguesonis TaxID=2081791 RepID=UPI0037124801